MGPHSRWYVFHHIESGNTYDTQILAIYDATGPCSVMSFRRNHETQVRSTP
jgi:hypothetical protein